MIDHLGTVAIILIVGFIFTWIRSYFVASYSFWKCLKVPGPEPSIFFGNFRGVMFAKLSLGESLKQICDEFPDAPMIGMYARRTPVLLVRDPELIRDVLIKDFSSFTERGILMHEKIEPLSAHLINLEAKRWRPLRSKLSPAFTPYKMKQMHTVMLECGEYFVKRIDALVEKDKPIDCREVTATFTTDLISSCIFGHQSNHLTDEDSDFRKMGRKILQFNIGTRILSTMREAVPWLYKLLGTSAFPKDVRRFFMSMMKQIMQYRTKRNVHRGDLVDLLMEIRNKPHQFDFEITDSLITAQAFVIFLAGFETSSTTISHALLELAQRQDIQEKLRQEILASIEENNGNLSYDNVKEMKYLDMVFQESLRLRSPVVFHLRKATKEYTFRNKNITIPKGQKVWIPVGEIHKNPKYYPNPEVFDPERFSKENSQTRHPMTFLPFGAGPRNCIGMRFAVHQTKLGLIKILANYKVEVCEKTRLPFKPDPLGFLLQSVGGVHLKFSRLAHPYFVTW